MTEYEQKPSGTEETSPRVYTTRELVLRRVLFYAGIAVWVVILSIPFFFVVLGMRGEMSIPLAGDFPENRLRIWMVMEPYERGIGYSLPRVAERSDVELHVETQVSYLMWEGEGENAVYCQQYTQDSDSATWIMADTAEGRCE